MSVEITLEEDLSLRKALSYSGLSSSTYYYRSVPRVIKLDPEIIEKVKEVAFRHPSYGARRIASVMRRELHMPIDRKRVGRAFHVLNWIEPAKKKSEIIRSSSKLVRAMRPYELWETDITFVW